MQRFETAMNELHDMHRAANPFYARVYDDYMAFAATIRGWHEFTEHAFDRFVFRTS
jgi:TRAP-type mannitol/chloroaromatic compound transport system substrate-binding protein